MNIVLMLFKNEEPLDHEALLGHIAITNDSGIIRAKNTYIDSWLDALIRGLREIQEGSHCAIDLIDEPDPLVFDISGKELFISYRGATVSAGSVQSFTQALRSAASLFLETVCEDAGETGNELLKEIRDFALRG